MILNDGSTSIIPAKTLVLRPRRPLQLIYYEAHLSQSDAMRREKYFKTSKGKSTVRQMLRNSLEELLPGEEILA